MKENFDYERVEESRKNIEELFRKFSENVASINKVIDESINKNNGAVYGVVGKKLINLWKENSSNFDIAFREFSNLSSMIVQVGVNNWNLEEKAEAIK